MIKILYRKIRLFQSAEDKDGLTICSPLDGDIETFLKETEDWVNANSMHIVSVTPVTGGLLTKVLNMSGGPWGAGMKGTATTCGLIIVAETT